MKYCNYISNVKDYIRWKAGVCFFQLNALSSYSILCFQPLFVTSHVDFRISKVEKRKKIFFTLIEDRNTTHAYRRCATTLELLYYSFFIFPIFYQSLSFWGRFRDYLHIIYVRIRLEKHGNTVRMARTAATIFNVRIWVVPGTCVASCRHCSEILTL